MRQPPKGWKVEMNGLLAGVVFHHATRHLFWCDGQWFMEQLSVDGRWVSFRANGVPPAHDMKSARAIGTAWLYEYEGVSA